MDQKSMQPEKNTT